MKYEGHFLLWYLILMPFAKLGFPYYTTNIISWAITCLSVWLILDKAPFKFYKRVLLIFTFPFLYLFPVISRCYCLIPLAIVLMCIFYKDRKEKPLRYLLSIVLLANTHVIMLGMVGIVLLDYILEFYKDSKNISIEEKKKRIYSFIITIILLIISAIPLVGCLGANQELKENNDILLKLLRSIIYHPREELSKMFFSMNNKIIIAIAIVLFFYEIKNSPTTTFKMILCIWWQCLICSFIYGSTLQRSSTIILIILYFKWTNIFKENKKLKDIDKITSNILLLDLVIINIIGGVIFILLCDVTYNYSNAYEMGNYINYNLDDGSIILNGTRVEMTSSIIPYIKKNIRFYHVAGNRFFTYTIWDKQNNEDIKIEDIKNLLNIFDTKQKLYYMYNMRNIDSYGERTVIEKCVNRGIFKELFFTNNQSICDENFIIYEVNLENFN